MVSIDPEKINEQELRNLFTDIRKTQNNRDNMDNLVEYLVDEETLSSCCYEKFNQTFCEAYTIKLLEKYIHHEKDRQLMLAIYGLLDGYKNIGIKERCKKYAKEAAEFDKRMKPYWSDANGSIRSKEENKAKTGIVDKLLKEIMTAVSDDKEVNYNLAKDVDKELSEKFPDGIPKELPLEKPLYLSEGSSGDTIDEIKGATDDKKQGSKIRRLRIVIVILILAVIFLIGFVFVIYMKFNNASKQDKNGNYEPVLTENGTFQSDAPVSIRYGNDIFIDLSVPATVNLYENGFIKVDINMEFDKGNGNDENDNLKGVDDHEEKQ